MQKRMQNSNCSAIAEVDKKGTVEDCCFQGERAGLIHWIVSRDLQNMSVEQEQEAQKTAKIDVWNAVVNCV